MLDPLFIILLFILVRAVDLAWGLPHIVLRWILYTAVAVLALVAVFLHFVHGG